MALVVTFNEYNGVGEDNTDDITDVTFGNLDDADFTPADNPITASENSFDKYIKAEFTGMAGEGISEIANTKWYKSAGNYKTGEAVKMDGLSVSYATPSESSSGDSDIPVSEPGAQNVGLNGADDGVLTVDGESEYIRMQRQTSGATPAGALNDLTFILLYDVS